MIFDEREREDKKTCLFGNLPDERNNHIDIIIIIIMNKINQLKEFSCQLYITDCDECLILIYNCMSIIIPYLSCESHR